MAGTMHTEPTRLTRSSLIGQSYRILKVYGPSVIGASVYLRYAAAVGCREGILRAALSNALIAGRSGFQCTSSEARPCSRRYYERRFMSWQERERRELVGRAKGGEVFEVFMRRQAS